MIDALAAQLRGAGARRHKQHSVATKQQRPMPCPSGDADTCEHSQPCEALCGARKPV